MVNLKQKHESSSRAGLLAVASPAGSASSMASAAASSGGVAVAAAAGGKTDLREITLDVAIAIATFVVLQLLGIPFWARLLICFLSDYLRFVYSSFNSHTLLGTMRAKIRAMTSKVVGGGGRAQRGRRSLSINTAVTAKVTAVGRHSPSARSPPVHSPSADAANGAHDAPSHLPTFASAPSSPSSSSRHGGRRHCSKITPRHTASKITPKHAPGPAVEQMDGDEGDHVAPAKSPGAAAASAPTAASKRALRKVHVTHHPHRHHHSTSAASPKGSGSRALRVAECADHPASPLSPQGSSSKRGGRRSKGRKQQSLPRVDGDAASATTTPAVKTSSRDGERADEGDRGGRRSGARGSSGGSSTRRGAAGTAAAADVCATAATAAGKSPVSTGTRKKQLQRRKHAGLKLDSPADAPSSFASSSSSPRAPRAAKAAAAPSSSSCSSSSASPAHKLTSPRAGTPAKGSSGGSGSGTGSGSRPRRPVLLTELLRIGDESEFEDQMRSFESRLLESASSPTDRRERRSAQLKTVIDPGTFAKLLASKRSGGKHASASSRSPTLTPTRAGDEQGF